MFGVGGPVERPGPWQWNGKRETLPGAEGGQPSFSRGGLRTLNGLEGGDGTYGRGVDGAAIYERGDHGDDPGEVGARLAVDDDGNLMFFRQS